MQIIATRQLTLKAGNDFLPVTVRLLAPVPDETGVDWKCPYEVECGTYRHSWRMHGVDALQALQLSIATLDVELEVLARELNGELLYFDKPFRSILENGGLLKAPPPAPFDPDNDDA